MEQNVSKSSLLLEPKLWNFFDQLITFKLKTIEPEFDGNSQKGYRYPLIENLLEMDINETIETLEMLYHADILKRDYFDTIIVCPECRSIDIHLKLECPTCQSAHAEPVQVIEHFSCGKVFREKDVTIKKGNSICPECNAPLTEEGVDFATKQTLHCSNCGNFTPTLTSRFLCFSCKANFPMVNAQKSIIYSYSLNMNTRSDLVKILSYRPILPIERPSRSRKPKIDRLDVRIINMLQIDARTSFREIARRTGVSDATVRDRVSKMQKNGLIDGFATIVNPAKMGMNISCFLSLTVQPTNIANVISNLKEIKEVKSIYELAEKENLFINVILEDKESLRKFINEKIYPLEGVNLHKVFNVLNIAKNDFRLYL